MTTWVGGVGVVAACLVGCGLFLGAGAWLSDRPPRKVGVQLMLALVTFGWMVLLGGGVSGWVVYERGWLGPRFPFSLAAPAGYDGLAAVRFCPAEGQAPAGRVELDALGLATVMLPPSAIGDRYEVDVRFADGSVGTATLRGGGIDGPCEWVAFDLTERGGGFFGEDIARYVARARELQLPFSRVTHQLPFTLVVPAGYRGVVLLEYCLDAPPYSNEVVVDTSGVVTLLSPMPWGVDETFGARDEAGTPLAAHVVRDPDNGGSCQLLEVMVDTPEGTVADRRTSLPAADVLAIVRATQVSYAEAFLAVSTNP
jgi:hypothetical protein